jgi:hypothetical protein
MVSTGIQFAGWVERLLQYLSIGTQQRWVSLRSTHPTAFGRSC